MLWAERLFAGLSARSLDKRAAGKLFRDSIPGKIPQDLETRVRGVEVIDPPLFESAPKDALRQENVTFQFRALSIGNEDNAPCVSPAPVLKRAEANRSLPHCPRNLQARQRSKLDKRIQLYPQKLNLKRVSSGMPRARDWRHRRMAQD